MNTNLLVRGLLCAPFGSVWPPRLIPVASASVMEAKGRPILQHAIWVIIVEQGESYPVWTVLLNGGDLEREACFLLGFGTRTSA